MNNVIKDEIFGEIKNFETEVKWLGRKIGVSFDGGIGHNWSEEKKGFTKKNEFLKIEKLLKALNLPTEIEYPKDKISEIMKRDKKSTSDGINFVILKEIGEVEIMKIGEKEIFE